MFSAVRSVKMQYFYAFVYTRMQEYRISLNKSNKRFALAQEERFIRLVEIIKNVRRARYYMSSHFKKGLVIMNGDQMPLHRNESCTQKTMTLTGEQTYVKENYMLSRERITVYTQVSSDAADPMPLPDVVHGNDANVCHILLLSSVPVHHSVYSGILR